MDAIETIKTWREDGFDLEAKRYYDFDPDISWIGEFSSRGVQGDRKGIPLDESVLTRGGYLEDRGGRCMFFYPQRGAEEYAKQDEERLRAYYLEEWSLDIIGVHVRRFGVELGIAYLGGVESDSGAEHIEEILSDLALQALEEAREMVERLTA